MRKTSKETDRTTSAEDTQNQHSQRVLTTVDTISSNCTKYRSKPHGSPIPSSLARQVTSHLTSPSNESGRRSARCAVHVFLLFTGGGVGPRCRECVPAGPIHPSRVHHRSPGVLAVLPSRVRARCCGWFDGGTARRC